jgi:hypothetical protein
MTADPVFQPPVADDKHAAPPDLHRADIIQVDTALESMRDSGFDLTAAAGEPIDNSVEAGATTIRVFTHGASKRAVDEIAFADNGRGINQAILSRVLSMGFSSRYGQRGGLGRFGVGMKLAGLSLGRRIDVYTKEAGDPQIRHAYLDLDEIKAGTQRYISARDVDGWPAAYADAMTGDDGELPSGTLVVYSKVDRLTSGGDYGTSLDEKLAELRTFIARAYRKYLDKGLRIELNGKEVTLLDPLFLMDNPRIIAHYKPEDLRGRVIDEADIEISGGHSIHVTVTVVPEEFREKQGTGGNVDARGRDIREYQIADSAGKISMVRNGREINYDIVPKMLPAGVDKVDRYVGIEVEFPAELDEFFQVRNVKRGAVPVMKLRNELREWLERPVRQARKEIRAYWGEVETRERASAGDHDAVTDAVERAEKTAPMGQAGQDVTASQADDIIRELLEDLQLDPAVDAEQIEQIRTRIHSKPITLVDASWPGKEIFEISHLNGKAIVKLNHRHPFIRDVYDPLKAVAKNGADGMSADDLVVLARKAEIALEVLFLAYAKAENMHRTPEVFDDLRSYWGQFTQAYLREAVKGE